MSLFIFIVSIFISLSSLPIIVYFDLFKRWDWEEIKYIYKAWLKK